MATGSNVQQQAELCTQLCHSLQHKSTKLAASAPPHTAARMGCSSQQGHPNHHQTGDRWQRAATFNNRQSCAHNCATVCTTRVPSWQRAPHCTRRLEWGAAASIAAQTIAKRVIDGNGQQRLTTVRAVHRAMPQSAPQEYQAGS